MLGSAVLRRAVVLIAAAFVCAAPSHAQDEAGRMADTFARDADRAQARKADAARKAGEEAKAKKEAERKAAHARRIKEIRKQAEAQRVEAIARIRAEQTRAAEEEAMLARARQEAEDAKATGEIRRLIEQAEAARLRAEEILAKEDGVHREKHQPAPTAEQEIGRARADAESATRQAETAQAELAEQARLAAVKAAEHRRRIAVLSRVGRLRQARVAAQTRRLAQLAQAARAKADEEARQAFIRAAENRRLVKQLARSRQIREARLAAQQIQRAAEQQAQREVLERQAAEARRADEEARLALGPRRDDDEPAAARPPDARPPVTATAPAERPSYRPAAGSLVEHPQLGEPDWHVTVLMIMAPGNYGIRRGAHIADPVLCTFDGCYVSAGAERGAIFLPRRKALGFGNTFGRRAGACRRSLSCVFRGVALDYPAILQPVDLHILKHDRRRPEKILADSDCRLIAGRLTCSRGIYGDDYLMWIVPERLAAAAGPDVLEQALRDGLSPSRSAEVPPRGLR